MWMTETKINEFVTFYVREHYKDLSDKIYNDLKKQIESLIVKAFEDIFGRYVINTGPRLLNFQWGDLNAGFIHQEIMNDVKKCFNESYQKEVNNFLKSEEFIDILVERINKKQLKK